MSLTSPVFDIGSSDELMYPRAATRLSSGNIVVADAHASAVLLFDELGRPIRQVGRKGQGPGEFQVPSWLDACAGDSIFVLDPALSRMSVLDSAGTFVRAYTWLERPATLACSAAGVFAFASSNLEEMQRPNPKQPPRPMRGILSLGNTNGQVTKSLGEIQVAEFGPLGKVSRVAVADDRIYFGDGGARISVYTLTGRRAGSLPVKFSPRRATEAHFSRSIDSQVSVFADQSTREMNRRFLATFPIPNELPSYSQILTDPTGNVWVVGSFPGDSTTLLKVLTSDGNPLADVTVPVQMTVYETGDNYVLGSYEGNDGKPHVAMFSFDPMLLSNSDRPQQNSRKQ
ncbi:MAG: 6-bladed beta-propeller [Gemmatimonadota bacterium]